MLEESKHVAGLQTALKTPEEEARRENGEPGIPVQAQ
jgi:hypothetical protein